MITILCGIGATLFVMCAVLGGIIMVMDLAEWIDNKLGG